MKKIRLYFLLCISVAVSSCEKTVTDVDVPKVPAQLVLFGFISPEEEITSIGLGLSSPVFGKKSSTMSYIKDAVVTISNDGGQSFLLTYVDSTGNYQASRGQFPIQPGRTYTITASYGLHNAKASCTVPADSVGFSDVSAQKLGDNPSAGGPSYRFLYKWNDKPGTPQYYRTVIQGNGNGFGGFMPYDFCTNMYDDKNADGKTLGGNCESSGYFSSTGFDVYFYLLNTDIHYYEYHKRRINYYGDDPFSEPFPQYSNVTGGLGVFCSFRKTLVTLKVD